MAGGTPSRRGYTSLVERGVLPPPPPRPAPPPPPSGVGPERREERHCWVVDPPGWPGRWPGLLVEWRRDGPAWHGLVTFLVTAGDRPRLVQEWLAARHLSPHPR